MKILIHGDPHFGEYANNQKFLEYQLGFYEDVMFPYVIDNKIDYVVNLADTFTNRQSTSNYILSEVSRRYFNWFNINEIDNYILTGNHDCYYKESLSHSSLEPFRSEYNTIIDKPMNMEIGTKNNSILLSCHPYGTKPEDFIEGDYGFFHDEFKGYKMNASKKCEDGIDPSTIQKYKDVFIGHFHTPNGIYVGTPYQLNFSQFNDQTHGFIVLDTETGETERIVNDYSPKFITVIYNTNNITIDGLGETQVFVNDKKEALKAINHNYVRLIARTIDSQQEFELFKNNITNLREYSNLQILSDNFDIDMMDPDKITDTHELIKEYFTKLNNVPDGLCSDKLQKMFFEYYVKVKENIDKLSLVTGNIDFKYIKFKNFLSYGDYYTTVEFKNGIIRPTGGNGNGKTSFCIETINFLLFGRSLLGKKKPSLVNWKTGKKLLVEGVIQVDNDNYKIIRGIKPDKFEIYKNNDLIEQDAATKDYQVMLNEMIGYNQKQFQYMTLKNKKNYVPFSTMSTGDKREFIERMFQLEVFSNILELVKLDIKDNKNDLEFVTKDIDKWQEMIKLEQVHVNKLKEIEEDKINDKIEILNDKIEDTKSDNTFNEMKKAHTILKDNHSELINKDIDKTYTKMLNASNEDLKAIKTDVENDKNKINSSITKLNEKITKLKEDNSQDILLDEINGIKIEKSNLDCDMNRCKSYLESFDLNKIKKDIDELDESIDNNRDKIKKLELKNNTLKTTKDQGNKRIKQMKSICDDCPNIDKIQSDLNVVEIDNNIKKNNESIGKLTDEIKSLEKVSKSLHNKTIEFETEQATVLKYEGIIEKLDNKIENKNKEIEQTEKNNKEKIEEYTENITTLESDKKSKIKQAKEKYSSKKESIQKIEKQKQKEKDSHNKRIDEVKEEMQEKKDEITKLKKELQDKINTYKSELQVTTDLLDNIVIDKTQLNKLQKNLKLDNKKYDDMNAHRLYLDFIKELLTSSGSIKSYIINKYTDFFNYQFNDYLSKFNVPFGIIFDKNLDQKFVGGYEKLDYDNLSSGEEKSIDFAIMFAMDDLQEKLFNRRINLLVFDEILSGLDTNRTRIAFEMLKERSENKSVFIIEHLFEFSNDIDEWIVEKTDEGSKIIK